MLIVIIMFFLLTSKNEGKKYKWIYAEPVECFYFTEYNGDIATRYCLKDRNSIQKIIDILESSTKTDIDSVSEFPNSSFLIVMEINKINGSRRTIYYSENIEYFDMPYDKKYIMDNGSIKKIMKIYETYGQKLKKNSYM